MKKLMTSLLILSTVFAYNTKASEEEMALKETEIDVKHLQVMAHPNSMLHNYRSNFNLYNEKKTLEQRAEALSMTLWGNNGHDEGGLLSNLPVDPFERKKALIKRINATKELWVKRLELEAAESNFKAVTTATNIPGLALPKFLKE